MDVKQLYQDIILEHGKSPKNFGKLDGYSHRAKRHNPLCGDQISIQIIMEGEEITDVKFTGTGCAISTASASILTESIKGKNKNEIERIFENFHDLVTGNETEEDLGKLAIFEGVQKYPVRIKCAILSWHALMAAIKGEKETTTEWGKN